MSFKPFQVRNILVTGGAGFIGSHFIRYYLAQDPSIHIVNLDLLTYAGSLNNLADLPDPARHTFVKGDICDAACVLQLLQRYQIDTIVHFAAESHVDRSIAGPKAFIDTNVVGTFTLLETARQVWLQNRRSCRFHHISTDEVFGSLGPHDPAFTENAQYQPNSPYSASKAASDHLVKAYHKTYGLPVTLSHCSNNYGSYQHAEKLIPTIIRACYLGESIPIYGNGSNIRDWLNVVDHCAGIVAILNSDCVGESFNLGGHGEVANLEMAKKICTLMDELYPKKYSHHRLITFVTDRLGHDWRYAIDATKIFKKLHWRPTISLETGLRATIRFFIEQIKKDSVESAELC